MSKKRSPISRPVASNTTGHGANPTGPRRIATILAIVLVVVVLALLAFWWNSRPPAPATPNTVQSPAAVSIETLPAEYVGGAACSTCHAEEARLWRGSHHDLAMQEANEATVLGNFANQSIHQHDITSHFFKRGSAFYINTDGRDGTLTDYPIKYTFGVWPLQQYLVEFPGGRLQALPLAWDSRSTQEGGQRWFHLYPDEKIDHTDPLHWTGIYQNWNLQCAACHSTNLSKGYDAASNSYETRHSDLNVSCEACHGAGSNHLKWAAEVKQPYPADGDKGLVVDLHSRWNEAWTFHQDGARFAQRDKPADPALMNTCAACHARRSTLAGVGNPGAPLADTHRLAMLRSPLYHADGQQDDEVFVWGSYVQSRMFQKGVTCMDCHEAHTAKLRVEGNALCARCHNAAQFDSPKHHFHESGTAGAECVECHMPAKNYMVVDARRDHSIRVPRPDISQAIGTPNACTQCHADKQPAWAAAALDRWIGKSWRERSEYATTLHAGDTQGASAVPALLELAQQTSAPALVRATAATLLQPFMRQDLLIVARALLKDPDPEVRIAALGMIEPADPINRVLSGSPLLEDPVLGVRVEAARILAEIPDDQIPESRRGARASAMNELLSGLQQDADWPTANTNLGNLYLRQGKTSEAIAAYERALELDPEFAGAYANLADVYRSENQEDLAEQVLRRGLAKLAQSADLHHALGLLLVRKKETSTAVLELAQAAQLAADNSHYTYVYAVALNSTGQASKALEVLREADLRRPNSPEILGTLVSIYRETGDTKAALEYARKLVVALPGNPDVQKLVNELEATQ